MGWTITGIGNALHMPAIYMQPAPDSVYYTNPQNAQVGAKQSQDYL